MIGKISLNYSPNFSIKKRIKKNIKFIVFHYTGMKSENKAISRLTDVQSKVSCHYFVKRNGKIILMVPESFNAWHAGKSYWNNIKNLNDKSIGIEIQNFGHLYGYQNYTKNQIKSIIKISNYLSKKYNIQRKNFLGHSDIAYDRKQDPGEKFPWEKLAKSNIGIWHNIKKNKLIKLRGLKISKFEEKQIKKYLKKIGYNVRNSSSGLLAKAFQRRFRQDLIKGKFDRECLVISKKLSNS
tara:strand:+ start:1662 stop:2378 length:717 start_codon:yes stop_codon:yes gene_type:complete